MYVTLAVTQYLVIDMLKVPSVSLRYLIDNVFVSVLDTEALLLLKMLSTSKLKL